MWRVRATETAGATLGQTGDWSRGWKVLAPVSNNSVNPGSRLWSLPGAGPLRAKPIGIGHVERVEDALAFGSEGQLFLVGLLGKTGIHNSDHRDTTRTKSRD